LILLAPKHYIYSIKPVCMNKRCFSFLVFTVSFFQLHAQQLTKQDYARAVSFISSNLFNKKVFNINTSFTWSADSSGLSFLDNGRDGKFFNKLEWKTMKIETIFDHERLAKLLSDSLKREIKSTDLPFNAVLANTWPMAVIAAVSELGLEARAGVHTGECEIIDGKPGGLAVVVGARISSMAASGVVLASSTVKDLVVGSGITFEDRGEHELKGVPGTWALHAVVNAEPRD